MDHLLVKPPCWKFPLDCYNILVLTCYLYTYFKRHQSKNKALCICLLLNNPKGTKTKHIKDQWIICIVYFICWYVSQFNNVLLLFIGVKRRNEFYPIMMSDVWRSDMVLVWYMVILNCQQINKRKKDILRFSSVVETRSESDI